MIKTSSDLADYLNTLIKSSTKKGRTFDADIFIRLRHKIISFKSSNKNMNFSEDEIVRQYINELIEIGDSYFAVDRDDLGIMYNDVADILSGLLKKFHE